MTASSAARAAIVPLSIVVGLMTACGGAADETAGASTPSEAAAPAPARAAAPAAEPVETTTVRRGLFQATVTASQNPKRPPTAAIDGRGDS